MVSASSAANQKTSSNMKIENVEQVPVIPPPPWLQASEKQFKESQQGLRPLGTNEIYSASDEWEQHKSENPKLNTQRPAFGKPTGPADALRPYAQAIRAKRLLK